MRNEAAHSLIDKNIPLTWLLGLVFALIAWGFRLESKVQANERDIQKTVDIDQALLDKVDRIEKNQLRIMDRFEIPPVR